MLLSQIDIDISKADSLEVRLFGETNTHELRAKSEKTGSYTGRGENINSY